MTEQEQQQLAELKSKSKLSPKERVQLKILTKKSKAETVSEPVKTANVFAVKPTTKISPLPIRFLEHERVGLKTLANDIKSQSLMEVIDVLGSENDINDTKLVRAAVLLLKQHSHNEIIAAIKETKLNMVR
ncbi:hypothetical protein [Moritella yayanosii]|uniref:Uncharacterized protein n=1 Tax=Moritella yayanosii TaxID=69539 RepID=A0A330LRB7_9GAMM|nr:hypothetical protein [Moritella yayanosii]SQD78746.1 conserved protein of unknown function [Moritella yayanosii]